MDGRREDAGKPGAVAEVDRRGGAQRNVDPGVLPTAASDGSRSFMRGERGSNGKVHERPDDGREGDQGRDVRAGQ